MKNDVFDNTDYLILRNAIVKLKSNLEEEVKSYAENLKISLESEREEPIKTYNHYTRPLEMKNKWIFEVLYLTDFKENLTEDELLKEYGITMEEYLNPNPMVRDKIINHLREKNNQLERAL